MLNQLQRGIQRYIKLCTGKVWSKRTKKSFSSSLSRFSGPPMRFTSSRIRTDKRKYCITAVSSVTYTIHPSSRYCFSPPICGGSCCSRPPLSQFALLSLSLSSRQLPPKRAVKTGFSVVGARCGTKGRVLAHPPMTAHAHCQARVGCPHCLPVAQAGSAA